MRAFVLLVSAGLGCAALGGGFGWVIGALSPEFLELLTQPIPVADPERLGTAMGLISGLFLGVVAMGFGLLVEAFRAWAVRRKAEAAMPESGSDHDGLAVSERSSVHVRQA